MIEPRLQERAVEVAVGPARDAADDGARALEVAHRDEAAAVGDGDRGEVGRDGPALRVAERRAIALQRFLAAVLGRGLLGVGERGEQRDRWHRRMRRRPARKLGDLIARLGGPAGSAKRTAPCQPGARTLARLVDRRQPRDGGGGIVERGRRVAHRQVHARTLGSDVAGKAGFARRRIASEIVEQRARVGDASARGERACALQLERGARAAIVESRAHRPDRIARRKRGRRIEQSQMRFHFRRDGEERAR